MFSGIKLETYRSKFRGSSIVSQKNKVLKTQDNSKHASSAFTQLGYPLVYNTLNLFRGIQNKPCRENRNSQRCKEFLSSTLKELLRQES